MIKTIPAILQGLQEKAKQSPVKGDSEGGEENES